MLKKPSKLKKRREVHLSDFHVAMAHDKAKLPLVPGNRNDALRYCIEAAPVKPE